MNKKILFLMFSFVFMFTFACKKEGVSLVEIGLRNKPSEKKGDFQWIKGVNRGQVVKITNDN